MVGFRRGLAWRQPAVPLFTGVAVPAAWASLVYWLGPTLGTALPGIVPAALLFGAMALVVAAWTVLAEQPLWLAASLQGGHLLLIPAAWSGYGLTGAVVALLLLSGWSWIIGILVLRRSWRVIGLADSWRHGLIRDGRHCRRAGQQRAGDARHHRWAAFRSDLVDAT